MTNTKSEPHETPEEIRSRIVRGYLTEGGIVPTKQDAEIASLQQELPDCKSSLRAVEAERERWKRDWEISSQARQIETDRAEAAEEANKRLREALEPFATFAESLAKENPGWDHDDFAVFLGDHRLTLAPFRRARALASETAGGEPQ